MDELEGLTGTAQPAFVLLVELLPSFLACVWWSGSVSTMAFLQGQVKASLAALLWHLKMVLSLAWSCQWGTAEVAL